MRHFQLLAYPHFAFWAIFISNLPYTSFGGHYRQTLFISVEVSSPDGNFDILGKSFLPMLWISESKFWFWNNKDLDFTRLVDFFQGGSPTKLWSKKIFFMKSLSKLGALTVLLMLCDMHCISYINMLSVKTFC